MPFLVKSGLDPPGGPDPVDVAAGFHERAETLRHMAVNAHYCYEDFDVVDAKSAQKHVRPVILEPLKAARAKLASLGD